MVLTVIAVVVCGVSVMIAVTVLPIMSRVGRRLHRKTVAEVGVAVVILDPRHTLTYVRVLRIMRLSCRNVVLCDVVRVPFTS